MSGPPPKPAHLRQRANRKAGAVQLLAPSSSETPSGEAAPTIPNPDNRVWHPLTLEAWRHAWASPMASQWIETDRDALGRLALVWDDFYRSPSADALKEIRLQSALFGLSPLDRSRLQWEVARADDAEHKQSRRVETTRKRTGTHDPRRVLMMVPK